MKKVKWNEYRTKRAGFARIRAKLGFERKSSSRVRDKEERELLFRLNQARLESWKKEGKFKFLASRRIKFKI